MMQVIAEHEAIPAAIAAHDPTRAGIAMEKHLEPLLGDISATQTVNSEYFDKQR
jgi:DNA-binding FadR family transcriptional regulator